MGLWNLGRPTAKNQCTSIFESSTSKTILDKILEFWVNATTCNKAFIFSNTKKLLVSNVRYQAAKILEASKQVSIGSKV